MGGSGSEHLRYGVINLRRVGCGAVLLVIVVYAILLSSANSRFEYEIEQLRARGEPVTLRDLAPKLAPGEPNAADLYLKAFALPHGLTGVLSGVPASQWSERDWADARAYLASHRAYYDLLHQASRIRTCAFPHDWDDPIAFISLPAPHGKMREAARELMLRAEVQSWDGEADAALDSCGEVFRLAEAAQTDPTLIGQLVAWGISSMGRTELGRVLSRGAPSPAACRHLYRELDEWKWEEAWVRAMRGERAWLLDFFRSLERGAFRPGVTGSLKSVGGWVNGAYVTVGRPLEQRHKLACLEWYDHTIRAYGLPAGENGEEVQRALAVGDKLPRSETILAGVFDRSVELRALRSRDRGTAELGAARIGLAAMAYRGEHGAYPKSLTDLEKDGWDVPRDPYTQQPFHYQRQGAGFIVYSVGPDLKDNNGRPRTYQRQTASQPFDLVFSVSASPSP